MDCTFCSKRLRVTPFGTAWTLNVKDDTDHDGMPDEWSQAKTTYTQPTPIPSLGSTVSGTYTGIGATHYTIEVDGRDTRPVPILFAGVLVAFRLLKILPL